MESSLKNTFVEFKDFIEATVDELIDLGFQSENWSLISRLYYRGLLAYLKNDTIEIKKVLDEAEAHSGAANSNCDANILPQIQILLRIRSQLRDGLIEPIWMEQLKTLANSDLCFTDFDLLIRSEGQFLLALTNSLTGNYRDELSNYRRAACGFEKLGLHRKSLKMQQNSIATEASLEPQRTFTVEYFRLLRLSLKHRDFVTAGLCCLNLSRNFQRLQSYRVALNFATKSLTYLKRDLGANHYAFALCQRAHVLIEMDRFEEAKIDLELAKSMGHKEVSSTIENLAQYLIFNAEQTVESSYMKGETKLSESPNKPSILIPAWKNRRWNLHSNLRISFGEKEEKIISLLVEGPKSKFDLMANVYIDEYNKLDFEVLYLRFKALISKIRKKAPYLLLYEDGHYKLTTAFKWE